jgi:hypothetical protein
MSTKIVEIPVPFEDASANAKRPSVDLNSFLSSDFSSFLNNEDAQALNSVPPQLQIHRQDSASSISSAGEWNIDDDFNSSVFLDNDEDFLAFNSQPDSFPESPSMEDLRNKLGNMRRPSMAGQKQEKEEDNEEDSSSESSSEASEDDESEETLLKKESLDEDYVPGTTTGDATIRPIKKTRLGVQKNDSFSSISSYSSGASSSDENEDDEHEDEFDDYDEEEDPLLGNASAGSPRKRVQPGVPKKYKQPASLRADDLTIGKWSLKKYAGQQDDVTFDIKILFVEGKSSTKCRNLKEDQDIGSY